MLGPSILLPIGSKNVFFDHPRGGFLAAEARFGRHFSLGASVNFAFFEAKMERVFDPRLLVEPVAPPSSEFVFQGFEGEQRLILPEITASFRFFDSKKWSPRLTVAHGWRISETEKSEFKFRNPTTGEDIESPQKHSRHPEIRGNQWSLRAGLERRIGGRFSAFSDAGATVDFGQRQRGFALGAARLGVAFGF